MPDNVRVPGRYGRRAPKHAPALKLGPLLTGVVPDHPAAEDYLAAMGGGWQDLGNDRAGDCVSVTWANIRRLVTGTLTGSERYPSQDEVWALYRTQNPDFDPAGSADTNGPGSAADGGMVVQAVLEYLTAHAGPDGARAVCFAQVDHANPDEVRAAIAIFGCLWTGISVQQANEDQFRAGQPWTWDPAAPVIGGHSVITAGYGPTGAGALGGDERFITWAQETSFTDGFWAGGTDECWVVIWPEHLGHKAFLEGVDQTRLAAGYEALTGRPFPAPAPPPPPPAPAPPAPEGLLAELAAFCRHVAASADRDIADVIAWLRQRGL